MSLLKKEGQDTALTVIGDGPSMVMLRKMAEDYDVSDRVEFVGRLALNDEGARARVNAIMRQSHVGLIPHFATESCNTTVPNKLFDYMIMGLPVVVSGSPETSDLVFRIEGRVGQRMPLNRNPLNQNQINGIRAWIAEGLQRN